MTKPVPRTCTEITQNEPDHRGERKSRPLKEFRSKPAYVLLGDPGAGKTTAFEVESGELGEEAVPISARDFITFSVSSHPEWRGKTLFIDGLDEVRAGSSDALSAFHEIRTRLDDLGRPCFRISCREADWLGDYDRSHLAAVTPDSNVTTLRLDPLTDSDIEHILDAHPGVDDAQDFVSKARETGIEGLLANPQTLNMLADVVGEKKGWPASRLETFDQACMQMAKERNQAHAYAIHPPVIGQLLDAGGHLCAVQLLSGAAGFSLKHNESDADYPAYDAGEYESPEVLRYALSTRLFKGVNVGRFVPVHRHIAEFLGARHLAKLISEGLPVRRVISLIAGEDGVVVTELRGLSAWLAAQSRTAREELIRSDPIGVGLYGDIREFTADEKRKLILSLNREVTRLGYSPRFAAAFGPLASPDMESTLREELTKSDRDDDHQLVVEFLLRVLQEAMPQPRMSQIMLDIVRDLKWPTRVTQGALYAFMHNSAGCSDTESKLRQLLEDVHAGRISDPDNEILGRLLFHLYPREIRPSEVWDYLNEKGDRRFPTMYHHFWEYLLPKKLGDGDVPELLDRLHERLPALRPALEGSGAHELPMKLLARGLRVHGDELNTARLYDWLSAGAYRGWGWSRRNEDPGEPISQVRAWLEQRPEVQKAVLVDGLIRCEDSDAFSQHPSSVWSFLHGSALPPGFELWCLDRAVELVESHPRVSEFLLDQAAGLYEDRTNVRGISQSVLVERTRGHELLEGRLAYLFDLLGSLPPAESPRTVENHLEEDKRRREHWIDSVRSNADALRENQAIPSLLYDIARVYLAGFPSQNRNATGKQRIRESLQDDDGLAEAALAGLRGTIWRYDVPEPTEIIRLRSEGRMSYLGVPLLAGLDEIERAEPALLPRLGDDQMRKALAFYYCVGGRRDTGWYLRWLESHPELVANVLAQCAASAIRCGEESIPGLAMLAHLESHSRVASSASPASA